MLAQQDLTVPCSSANPLWFVISVAAFTAHQPGADKQLTMHTHVLMYSED